MRTPRFFLAATCAASAFALTGCATAQQPGGGEQDHQVHHPENAGAKPDGSTTKPAPPQGQAMGQGGMGQGGMGMMGEQGMMGKGSMDMCPMMGGGKTPQEHQAMMQQRLKNMSPEQVKQAMGMMDKQMSMMQGDMQMMRDRLATQPK